ncbi:MAG TPA: lysylphosphatidylglycerol synthase transmembrane domain-containing protein [Gemmatimonadota bacterium]|nr:lysylphosphatidylglycerol synthase transmembrane domain-containing protein [Gemmatimonadota bacterium]
MKTWKAWLGVAVSAAAIWFAARGVEWNAVGAALVRADYGILALVLLLTPLVNVGVRAVRWRVLLLPVRRVRLADCLSATAIGLMANNVLPARIGEFVRAYALGRRRLVPTGTAFGALFVERMLDGFALVGLLFAVTLARELPEWVDTTAQVAFAIFAGFLALQLGFALRPRAFVGLTRWISQRVLGGRFEEAAERAIVTFVDGFQLLRRPALLILSLLLAFVQWSLISGLYYLGLAAFGLAAEAGLAGAFFTDSVTSLGVAVPSSPGFVGTFQAFVVESLAVFGIPPSAAFSFSVGFHAVSYVGVTVVGLWFFLREGLTWKDLERSEADLEHELEEEYETAIEPGIRRDARLP